MVADPAQAGFGVVVQNALAHFGTAHKGFFVGCAALPVHDFADILVRNAHRALKVGCVAACAFCLQDIYLIVKVAHNVKVAPENMAIGMVRDACGQRYDITAELSKTGSSRNATLIRWMATLTAYLLYGSIADNDVPERVVKNYDDVMSELRLVNSGKMSVQLDRISDSTGKKTRFQFGSETRREHNAF